MRSNREKQLFETLKNSSTEFTFEQIEGFIEQLPEKVNETKRSAKKSGLSSLARIIVSILLLVGLATIGFFVGSSRNDEVLSDKALKTKAQELSKIIQPSNDNWISIDSNTSILESKTLARKPSLSIDQATGDDLQTESLVDEVPLALGNSAANPFNEESELIGSPIYLCTENNPIANYEGLDLVSLKRNLEQQLIADNIINSKQDQITILLNDAFISINNVTLDKTLFFKYKSITQSVGTGEYRQIVMNKNCIKAGDFSYSTFKGCGFGLFMAKEALSFEDRVVLLDEIDLLFHQRSLDIFAPAEKKMAKPEQVYTFEHKVQNDIRVNYLLFKQPLYCNRIIELYNKQPISKNIFQQANQDVLWAQILEDSLADDYSLHL